MSEVIGAHNELHSEQGALRGEHPGRSRNPVIKVADLAWLEFDKPDLDRAEAFAHAFGLQTAARDSGAVYLRGVDAGTPCVILRRGPQTRFRGFAFRADDEADLLRLASKTGAAQWRPNSTGALTRSVPTGSPFPLSRTDRPASSSARARTQRS